MSKNIHKLPLSAGESVFLGLGHKPDHDLPLPAARQPHPHRALEGPPGIQVLPVLDSPVFKFGSLGNHSGLECLDVFAIENIIHSIFSLPQNLKNTDWISIKNTW